MPDNNTNPDDQISFATLRLSIRYLLIGFFRFCSFIQLVIDKGRFIMLAGFLVGVIPGILYYYQSPKYYKGSMILTSTKLYKKTFADIVEQLNNVSSSGMSSSLSRELNISPDIAKEIRYFDTKNTFDKPLKEDTSTKLNQPFKIVIGLNNADSIARMQEALLAYLNNRPQLKHIREQESLIYTAKLKQLDSELANIDSLKREFNKFLATSKINATVYSSAINPAEIYEQSINLLREREYTQRLLTIENNAVSLLDGFKVSVSTRPISLIRLILITGTLGVMLGFTISFLLETRKKVVQ
ncbi:hypothetical protein [Paraflavitalea pollutisoli]|uniref:hypothetical protein n=1 Tax=Paraflavitalea pollutisoli TaxID=3034143 RepID=UPI0023EDD607|nr:hypothetical protein [Paraflavitalea sp. H1-2-19X]